MKKIFINKFGKLRSGWKIAIILAMNYGFQVAFGIIAGLGIMIYLLASGNFTLENPQLISQITSSPGFNTLFQIIGTIIMLISIYLVLKLIDKKHFKDIGLVSIKKGFKPLCYGLLFGALSMTLVFVILLATKNIELSNSIINPQFSWSTLTGFIMYILVGLNEELFSRGYCMMALSQTGKRWVSVVLSALIFSALHLGNPNVKILGLINIFLVGILFSYMVIKTNNIWMAVGYHITWNYFQGNIFNFPVSGLNKSSGLYRINVINDNLLTGGAFGPEAGIVVTLILIISIIILKFYKGDNTSAELFSQSSEKIDI